MNNEPDSIAYRDLAPYPPLQVCGPNPQYARIMLRNIASSCSEMSAISLYIYNSVILKGEQPDFADCFLQLSKVEMHHLDIFCQLASLLGADPRLWYYAGRKLNYWSPRSNEYPRRMLPMLEYAIRGENDTIKSYKRQTQWIRDTHIVDNLNRIITDEERHIELLTNMLEKPRATQ